MTATPTEPDPAIDPGHVPVVATLLVAARARYLASFVTLVPAIDTLAGGDR